jgi:hypothetical protein
VTLRIGGRSARWGFSAAATRLAQASETSCSADELALRVNRVAVAMVAGERYQVLAVSVIHV